MREKGEGITVKLVYGYFWFKEHKSAWDRWLSFSGDKEIFYHLLSLLTAVNLCNYQCSFGCIWLHVHCMCNVNRIIYLRQSMATFMLCWMLYEFLHKAVKHEGLWLIIMLCWMLYEFLHKAVKHEGLWLIIEMKAHISETADVSSFTVIMILWICVAQHFAQSGWAQLIKFNTKSYDELPL